MGWNCDHHYVEPMPVQDSKLVLGQNNMKDGKYSHVLASGLHNKLHEDLERLKKIQAHRVLHHSVVFMFKASTPMSKKK